MDTIIKALEEIAEGNPWQVRPKLRDYIIYLKEVRENNVVQKETPTNQK